MFLRTCVLVSFSSSFSKLRIATFPSYSPIATRQFLLKLAYSKPMHQSVRMIEFIPENNMAVVKVEPLILSCHYFSIKLEQIMINSKYSLTDMLKHV